jgi:hypothetical protein
MNVRITKASKPTYWYANSIGTIFSVQEEPVKDPVGSGFDYVCSDSSYKRDRNIAMDDCEIVEAYSLAEREQFIGSLLPPDSVAWRVLAKWANATEEELAWLERIQAVRVKLGSCLQARTTVQDGPQSIVAGEG